MASSGTAIWTNANSLGGLGGGLITLASDFTIDAWRVAIEDDGPGVPAEQRERIFGRFVRLEGEHKLEDSGSGLGLAISRSILGLHRGAIRAEASTRGPGLRVVFEIPIAASTPPAGLTPLKGAVALRDEAVAATTDR